MSRSPQAAYLVGRGAPVVNPDVWRGDPDRPRSPPGSLRHHTPLCRRPHDRSAGPTTRLGVRPRRGRFAAPARRRAPSSSLRARYAASTLRARYAASFASAPTPVARRRSLAILHGASDEGNERVRASAGSSITSPPAASRLRSRPRCHLRASSPKPSPSRARSPRASLVGGVGRGRGSVARAPRERSRCPSVSAIRTARRVRREPPERVVRTDRAPRVTCPAQRAVGSARR